MTAPLDPTSIMRQQIQALLGKPLDALALRYELEALLRADSDAVEAAADLWAPAVFERDRALFADLLSRHLTVAHPDTIHALLPQLGEADETLYRTLYLNIVTPEAWDRDLLALVQSNASNAEVLRQVKGRYSFYRYRNDQGFTLSEATALALYNRDPEHFHAYVFEHIAQNTGGYSALAEAVRKANKPEWVREFFRHNADQAIYEAAIRRLLTEDVPAAQMKWKLERRTPDFLVELPRDLGEALLAKYGRHVEPYLEQHASWFMREKIDEALKADLNDRTLLERLSTLASRRWQPFNALAEVWAQPLVERAPAFFESFLRNHLGRDQRGVIRTLLPKIEAKGVDGLFKALYRQATDQTQWNAELLQLAQSDLSDEEVQAAIDHRDTTFALNAVTASALYMRNPDLFGEFVRSRIERDSSDIAPLLDMARQRGDDETNWRLFREWADNATWRVEMQRLLTQDISADAILSELEKRHPTHTESISPGILRPFYDKYGDVLLPYLEKHINLVTRERLESLLNLPIDRASLLRELEKMARSQREEFRALAEVWAPALYAREPVFFEGFLVRNLESRGAEKVIHALLPKIEAAGQDSLFKALYRKIDRNDVWQYEIKRLATSPESDEAVLRAIERREAPRWITLDEPTAIQLYQRNPALFRGYLSKSLRATYRSNGAYAKLRKVVQALGDDVLYQELFQRFATTGDWVHELEALLKQNAPVERVNAALSALRAGRWDFTPAFLTKLIEKYGKAVLPAIEPHLAEMARGKTTTILEIIHKLNDESAYRRILLKLSARDVWAKELQALTTRRLTDSDLWAGLQALTPDEANSRWSSWQLDPDTALALYLHQPAITRPFLERFVFEPDSDLFDAADESGDEEFLDFISYKWLGVIGRLVYSAYPKSRFYVSKPDRAARQKIDEMGGRLTQRFDRLYAESPETYVRHAANVLARFRAFEVWDYTASITYNPAFIYLVRQHHDAWLQSAAGIRELMESPNIHIQRIALELLAGSAESPDAAPRILENLLMFRALLLSGVRRSTKKIVLACLEGAVQHGPAFAEPILDVFEDTMDFRGRRAISAQLMVSFVRAQQTLIG